MRKYFLLQLEWEAQQREENERTRLLLWAAGVKPETIEELFPPAPSPQEDRPDDAADESADDAIIYQQVMAGLPGAH